MTVAQHIVRLLFSLAIRCADKTGPVGHTCIDLTRLEAVQ